jgi:hypothetical protein
MGSRHRCATHFTNTDDWCFSFLDIFLNKGCPVYEKILDEDEVAEKIPVDGSVVNHRRYRRPS